MGQTFLFSYKKNDVRFVHHISKHGFQLKRFNFEEGSYYIQSHAQLSERQKKRRYRLLQKFRLLNDFKKELFSPCFFPFLRGDRMNQVRRWEPTPFALNYQNNQFKSGFDFGLTAIYGQSIIFHKKKTFVGREVKKGELLE